MNIDFANLQLQYRRYKKDIDRNVQLVLDNANFIMGEEIGRLENQLALFARSNHAITCSSGTDALTLAMMALEISPGDEIITTPFTFIATAEAIALLNAVPIFVDIDQETFNIDPLQIQAVIGPKTKAIIAVGLFGQPSDMNEINRIAQRHGLKVIIDGAQCFGSTYNDLPSASHCDVYTTSFFPAKPLGCYGDGGAVVTEDDDLAAKIKMLRVHGQVRRYEHRIIGIAGRMDTVQAAVLLAKLPFYSEEIDLRNKVAKRYDQSISNDVVKPRIKKDRTSVWAQYTIRVKERSALQEYLTKHSIPTAVHYPIPLHLQECFKGLGYREGEFPIAERLSGEVLSLPMNPFLTNDEVDYVSSALNSFR